VLLARSSRFACASALGLLVATVGTTARASSTIDELLREARQHEAAHEDDVAARRYTEALGLDPTCGACYVGLSALRLRHGDAREAERVFSVALEHIPSFFIAYQGRAQARRQLGWRDEAFRDLETYTLKVPTDATALRELSRWYGLEGQYPAQLAAWRRILVLASREGDAALLGEARTTVRALQILVAPADPVTAPHDDPTRKLIATVARRGG
jgi:tetratricopeptide (TPR) repeat protein